MYIYFFLGERFTGKTDFFATEKYRQNHVKKRKLYVMNWARTGVLLLVLGSVAGTVCDAQVKKNTAGKATTGMKIKYVHPQDTSYLGISRAKNSFIQQTIKAHIDAGEDINNNAVGKAIMSDVASEIEMNPKKPLDTRSTKVLMELARKQIEKQFPENLPISIRHISSLPPQAAPLQGSADRSAPWPRRRAGQRPGPESPESGGRR